MNIEHRNFWEIKEKRDKPKWVISILFIGIVLLCFNAVCLGSWLVIKEPCEQIQPALIDSLRLENSQLRNSVDIYQGWIDSFQYEATFTRIQIERQLHWIESQREIIRYQDSVIQEMKD